MLMEASVRAGADLAELLPAVQDLVKARPRPGPWHHARGQPARTNSPYDPAVMGIYSTEPGFVGGVTSVQDYTSKVPLAIVGIVPCKVNTDRMDRFRSVTCWSRRARRVLP